MVLPLAVLAVPAALIGFANIHGGVEHLLVGALPQPRPRPAASSVQLAHRDLARPPRRSPASALAWAFYSVKGLGGTAFATVWPVHTLLARKYYLDDLYEGSSCGRAPTTSEPQSVAWFDTTIVDGIANGVAGRATRRLGDGLRLLQTGPGAGRTAALGLAGLIVMAFLILCCWNPL